jgi:hypothetical protein
MTLFSTAAAAALERSDDDPQPGVYSYATELEITVKTNGKYAPAIVVKVLAQIVLDEPDVVFAAGDGTCITVDNFPQSKSEFDAAFCTSTTGDKLTCKFEIQSSRHSFHSIKIGVWDILKEAHVWLKKSPSPVQKTPLTAIGFWMNIHPGFASSRVFHSQLLDDIDTQYKKNPDTVALYTLLPVARIPIDMYLCRRKINADYSSSDVTQPFSTADFYRHPHALCAQSPNRLGHVVFDEVFLSQYSILRQCAHIHSSLGEIPKPW